MRMLNTNIFVLNRLNAQHTLFHDLLPNRPLTHDPSTDIVSLHTILGIATGTGVWA